MPMKVKLYYWNFPIGYHVAIKAFDTLSNRSIFRAWGGTDSLENDLKSYGNNPLILNMPISNVCFDDFAHKMIDAGFAPGIEYYDFFKFSNLSNNCAHGAAKLLTLAGYDLPSIPNIFMRPYIVALQAFGACLQMREDQFKKIQTCSCNPQEKVKALSDLAKAMLADYDFRFEIENTPRTCKYEPSLVELNKFDFTAPLDAEFFKNLKQLKKSMRPEIKPVLQACIDQQPKLNPQNLFAKPEFSPIANSAPNTTVSDTCQTPSSSLALRAQIRS